MTDFSDIDALVADYQRRGGQPGLAYGIVRDGELVHAAGFGERGLGGPVPDADTVFRIASMTKSFTASAVLLLRDEGRLALDDPAERYVPELRGWSAAAEGATPVSIRNLLTMTAGFPTDDPWGDRQQGLPLDEFAKFLADGVSFNWVPGTRFEYSNLGYAILGLIIAAVTSTPYKDFVRDRLMTPLGMTRSGYETPATDNVASGYRHGPDGWVPVPFDPYGAFAPMGGVFTCVRDLARWVAGFGAAFGQTADNGHPLAAASRREMQLPQIPTGWDRPATFPADSTVTAYGFGLAIADESGLGRVAGHGGGYPGFGSYMRWHLASGTGVIALANSTYARMSLLSARVLRAVLGADAARDAAPRPWPRTLAARDAATALLTSWDDAEADRLCSPNVALDTPYPERRNAIALVRDRIGDFRASERPAQHDTPAHCRWWLTGERGTVQVQIQLTPERPPRLMSLILAVPPAPGSPLGAMLEAVLAWLNGTGPAPEAPDAALLERRLHAAAAWAGRCALTAYTAGNGTSTATAELTGEHATLTLAVTIDPGSGQLVAVDIM